MPEPTNRDVLRALEPDNPAGLTDDEREAVRAHLADLFTPKPPDPHPFAATSGAERWGGKCGHCGGPGGAPWHSSAVVAVPEPTDGDAE
jgi:hypothetical protein